MCVAQFDFSFQQDFYKPFSSVAVFLSWQSPWTLQKAELSKSCVLSGVLP